MTEELIVPREQTNRITNTAKKFKYLLLITTIVFIISIPLIVVTAIAGIISGVVIFSILCGICFLSSFYGWMFWGLFNGKKNLLVAIANNHLTTVAEMSENTGKTKRDVKKNLQSLIKGGYLPGWKLNKDRTEIYSTSRREYKCPYCNAPYRPEDKVCSYCNGTIRV